MRYVYFLVAIACLGLSAPVLRAQVPNTTLTIEGYNSTKENVPIFTREGKRQGTVNIAELPNPGSAAIDETGDRLLYRVTTKTKGDVWLAGTSVKVTEPVTLSKDCDRIRKLQSTEASQRTNSGRGLGGECRD